MSRLLVVLALAAFAVGAATAPGLAAPAAKKREIVCCKKTAQAKDGRTVRRRVCRPRRRAVPRPAASLAAPTPAPQAAAPAAPGPVPAPATPGAAAGPSADVIGDVVLTGPPLCGDDSPWVSFTADDPLGVGGRLWTIKPCARAGRLLVQLRNLDAQDHNVWVDGPGTPARVVVADLEAGQTGQGQVDVTPGDWRFFCAIPGHTAMSRTLAVTPAS